MSKAIRYFCLSVGAAAIPVYVYDAKLTGRWDSDGISLAVGLIALVILEPPVAMMVRGYFARKKAREEREKKEKAEAAKKAAEAEKQRVQRERLAAAQSAADEAERLETRRKANEAWAKKQGLS